MITGELLWHGLLTVLRSGRPTPNKVVERHGVFALHEADLTKTSPGMRGYGEEKEEVWRGEVHARHGLASG